MNQGYDTDEGQYGVSGGYAFGGNYAANGNMGYGEGHQMHRRGHHMWKSHRLHGHAMGGSGYGYGFGGQGGGCNCGDYDPGYVVHYGPTLSKDGGY
jgi:hypothetical protein